MDYPGKLACIVFTQGCNFRCRYCHNPQLVVPEKFCPAIPEAEVLDFLKSRQSYLQGVVVSGGEPTIQDDLIPFLDKIKSLGYLIKLDTNGSQPYRLKLLLTLKLVDFIAMDVKAPLERYTEASGVTFPAEKIRESIDLVTHSGVEHEFRTTVVRPFCSPEGLGTIRQLLGNARCYHLQRPRLDEKILDPDLNAQEQYSTDEFAELKRIFEKDPMVSQETRKRVH